MKRPFIAVRPQIVFERLELKTFFGRDILNVNGCEIGLAGAGAETGKLRTFALNNIISLQLWIWKGLNLFSGLGGHSGGIAQKSLRFNFLVVKACDMSRANIIVLDIETKRGFEDVGGRNNLGALGVSLVGVYLYRQKEYQAYLEEDFPKLLSLLAEKPLVVGFNQRRFDFPVLQAYFKDFDLQKLPMVDILEDLTKTLGHRVSLDSVAQATLGIRKSGHGLDAIRYWNTGQIEKLKKYCLDDVRITREIFEYGAKHGEVFYTDKFGRGKMPAKVKWELELEEEAGENGKQYSLF